ncbi:hypothetical protein DH2020_047617 [Rehmannia glutinosa]|uniref:DUF4005 domain-containing protein n=1 Tax=Rehmannia glutinosa TaxID=99300 RepID=A0ABR0U814_REHGL
MRPMVMNQVSMERKRENGVVRRSYLCGDERNSVLAAEDSSEVDLYSFRSNRATNSSSTVGGGGDMITSVYAEDDTVSARRARDGGDEKNDDGTASPSRESIGTSIEVQTGNSSHIFSESFRARQTMRQRTTAQVLKIQLRICSKKKQITSNGDETNTGWSWLERWMAARQPEITDMSISRVRKRMLDAAMEEKESCGSNEVCSLVEATNLYAPRNVPRPSKMVIRSKATRSFSRQNSASSHLCPTDSKDYVKKVCHLEDEKEKRKRAKQPGNKRDIKNETTQVSGEHEIEQ